MSLRRRRIALAGIVTKLAICAGSGDSFSDPASRMTVLSS